MSEGGAAAAAAATLELDFGRREVSLCRQRINQLTTQKCKDVLIYSSDTILRHEVFFSVVSTQSYCVPNLLMKRSRQSSNHCMCAHRTRGYTMWNSESAQVPNLRQAVHTGGCRGSLTLEGSHYTETPYNSGEDKLTVK